jgi:DNA-binding IclR family transcriptional regulator
MTVSASRTRKLGSEATAVFRDEARDPNRTIPAVREFRSFTACTVRHESDLDDLLKQVAHDGVARQCAEFREDRGCLAVPIRAPGGGRLVAGLAVAGPPDRIAEPNEELLRIMRKHAEHLAPLLA